MKTSDHDVISMETNYIVRGTNSLLDEAEVYCTDLKNVIENGVQCIRKIKTIYEDYDDYSGKSNPRGLWIEQKYLIRVDEDENSVGLFSVGKHVRTVSCLVFDYEISLVEYENTLQYSVTQNSKDTRDASRVLASSYKKKENHQEIVEHMFSISKKSEVLDFVNYVEALD